MERRYSVDYFDCAHMSLLNGEVELVVIQSSWCFASPSPTKITGPLWRCMGEVQVGDKAASMAT